MSSSSCHRFIELFLLLNISCFDVDVEKGGLRARVNAGILLQREMSAVQGPTTRGVAAFHYHQVHD